MNLGINANGNSVKYILGNFIVLFLAQIAFNLYEMLALNRFPTEFEIYKSVITSLVATLAIYGINKATQKEKS